MKSIMPILLLVLTLLFFSFNVNAELMNSTNYKITSAVVSSAGTNTSSTNYQNNLVLGSLAGNINSSNYDAYLGFFQTITNNIPSISSVEIMPMSPNSSDDLTCTVTGWSDGDGDAENYYFDWYREEIFVFGVYQNETSYTLGSGNTTINDVWNCTVTPYDGYDNGTSITDQVSVENSAPSKPGLLEPNNGNNSLFSRYPTFTWNCTDNDGDGLKFSLEINISYGDVDRLYPLNSSLYSQEGNNYSYTIPDELHVYVENDNNPYDWRVRAYDGTNYSEWSDTFNFSIEETVIVNNINLAVDFGGPLDPEATANTVDGPANPFVFENGGNVNISLRNLTMSGDFWLSDGLGNDSLQFKADNYSDGGDNSTYNYSGSTTSWTNFSANNPNVVRNLYYGSGLNYIEVDLRIDVPWKEPPGSRSRNMTFYWRIDDSYNYVE